MKPSKQHPKEVSMKEFLKEKNWKMLIKIQKMKIKQLHKQGVPALYGIDTRRLTKKIREAGLEIIKYYISSA